MRVVCLVTNDLAQDQRMDRVCASLAGAGYDVTLVGRELPTSRLLAKKTYRTRRLRCRFHRGKLFYLEYNLRLFLALRRVRWAVVCAVDLDTLCAAGLLSRAVRARLVYDAHEWFTETPEVVGRPLVRAVWRWVARRFLPLTAARYTVGPRLAERLTAEYGFPFGVVRNLPRAAAPVAPNRQRDPRGRRVLLYQGILNPGRGLDVALDALVELPDCELWLIGSGPEETALRRRAAALGLDDRVWFAGFRPPAELPALTAAAWLGLNLLDAASPSYYYSLANKSLDYVQAHLPSVQMDFPEYAALNQTYGCYRLLFELSPSALVAAVTELITNPATYDRLRDGCRLAAEELTWEREEEELLRIWGKL